MTTWNTSVAEDGTYYVHVRAENGSHLWSEYAHFQVNIDATPPVISGLTSDLFDIGTLYDYTDDACRNDNDPTFEWVGAAASGIAGYFYMIDDQAPPSPAESWTHAALDNLGATPAVSFADQPDGVRWFHVKGLSNSGLWGPAKHYRVSIDTGPKTMTANASPHAVEASWYSSPTTTITWNSTSACGIDYYTYELNKVESDTPDQFTVASSVTSADFNLTSSGYWYFHITSQSHTGVWLNPPLHRTLRVDLSPDAPSPVTSGTHPSPDTWVNNNRPSFTWSAFAYSGIANYAYDITRVAHDPDPVALGPGTTYTYPEPGLDNGEWWFNVRAQNNVVDTKVWGPTTSIKIRVDTGPFLPIVESPTHPDNAVWYDEGIVPQFNFWSAAHSEISTFAYVMDATSNTIPASGMSGYTEIAPAADGTWAAPLDYLTKYKGTATVSKTPGVWYFHVRAKNGINVWGPTAHYMVRINKVSEITNVMRVSNVVKVGASPAEYQEGRVTIYDFNGYDNIRRVDLVIAQNNSPTWLNPRGWFTWERGSTGFYENGAYGNNLVALSQSLSSVVEEPALNRITVIFKWSLLTGYGDIQDNKLYAKAFDYTLGTAWAGPSTAFESNMQIPETIHVSPLSGMWVPTYRPTFTVQTVTDPNADDQEYYQFYLASGADAESGSYQRTSGWLATPSWTPDYDIPNGVYYWKVKTKDNHDWICNCDSANNGCDPWTVRIDGAKPVFTQFYATPHVSQTQWYQSNNPLMKWEATAISGIDCYSDNFAIQGSAGDVAAPTSCEYVSTQTSLLLQNVSPDATWVYHLRAKSVAGLWSNDQTYVLKIDATPPNQPVVYSDTHPHQNVWYKTTTMRVLWPGMDDTSGIINYSYKLDPNNSDAGYDIMGTATAFENVWNPVDSLTARAHHFFVRAQNGAVDLNGEGDWGLQTDFVVRVDNVPPNQPTITASSHTQTSWSTNAQPHFEWIATDPLSGIHTYCFGIDQLNPDPTYTGACTITQNVTSWTAPTPLTEGTYWFHVRAQDDVYVYNSSTSLDDFAGQWGAYRHYKVMVDPTAPTDIVITSNTHSEPTAWYQSTLATLAWTANDTSGITSHMWDIIRNRDTDPLGNSGAYNSVTGGSMARNMASSGDGVWYFVVRAQNGAGLWSNRYSYTLNLDTTAPDNLNIMSLTHPEMTPVRNAYPSFNWTATDTLSGVRDYCVNLFKVDPANPADQGTCDTSVGANVTTSTSQTYNINDLYPAAVDGMYCLNLRARNNARTSDYNPLHPENGGQPGIWSDVTRYCIIIEMTGAGSPVIIVPNQPVANNWYSDSQEVRFQFSSNAASRIMSYRYRTALDINTGIYDALDTNFVPGDWTTLTGVCDDPDTPEDEYVAPINMVSYGTTVPEGEWYFHVMARSCAQDAEWSTTSHRKIRLDPTPPTIAKTSVQLGSPTHDENEWCSVKNPPTNTCKNPILWFISDDTGSDSCGEGRILSYSWKFNQKPPMGYDCDNCGADQDCIDTCPDTLAMTPTGLYGDCDGSAGSGQFKRVDYQNIGNGVWYFHVRARSNAVNKTGNAYLDWGQPEHYRLKIDVAPDGSVRISNGIGIVGIDNTSPGWMANETAHYTKLSAFYLNTHEVTNAEYQTCKDSFESTAISCRAGYNDSDCRSMYGSTYEWDPDTMECVIPGDPTYGRQCDEGKYCWVSSSKPRTGLCAKGCDPSSSNPTNYSLGSRTHYFDGGSYTNYPVVYVTWYQAQQYCLSQSMRLPTEHEWEIAAHGWRYNALEEPIQNTNRWPWGNVSPDDASWTTGKPLNFGGTGVSNTTPANLGTSQSPACFFDGSAHSVSGFGSLSTADGRMKEWSVNAVEWLCDMSGNVAEWVIDWNGLYPEITTWDPMPADGVDPRLLTQQECYARCNSVDTVCLSNCDMKTIRGGSFMDSAMDTRVFRRDQFTPHLSSFDIGFRCAAASPNQD